jgi:hypothetical protein
MKKKRTFITITFLNNIIQYKIIYGSHGSQITNFLSFSHYFHAAIKTKH